MQAEQNKDPTERQMTKIAREADRRKIHPRITGSVLLMGELQRNVTVCPAARMQRRWRRQR